MMKQNEQALQWAVQYLTSDKKSSVLNYQEIAQTSYSFVYMIKTTTDTFYLKQTPKALFLDSKILDFLNKQGCKNIPNVISVNNALCCFLMTSVGDISLRHLFKGKIDLNKLNQGIANFTKIQRAVENKLDYMLSLNIPDWRLDKFPSLYLDLIKQEKLLLNDGLTKKEIDQLHQLHPLCIRLCENLSEYKIPETISHCDFHENNMIHNKKTGDVNIIDWGEVVIAHPFFSLNGCLWNLTYFKKLKQTDKIYHKIQLKCVAPWLDLFDEKTLLEVLNITNQLNGIYAALGYQRIYSATKAQQKKVQQEHHGAIAGCLKSFLYR